MTSIRTRIAHHLQMKAEQSRQFFSILFCLNINSAEAPVVTLGVTLMPWPPLMLFWDHTLIKRGVTSSSETWRWWRSALNLYSWQIYQEKEAKKRVFFNHGSILLHVSRSSWKEIHIFELLGSITHKNTNSTALQWCHYSTEETTSIVSLNPDDKHRPFLSTLQSL